MGSTHVPEPAPVSFRPATVTVQNRAWWFSEDVELVDRNKDVCADCRVRELCLVEALAVDRVRPGSFRRRRAARPRGRQQVVDPTPAMAEISPACAAAVGRSGGGAARPCADRFARLRRPMAAVRRTLLAV